MNINQFLKLDIHELVSATTGLPPPSTTQSLMYESALHCKVQSPCAISQYNDEKFAQTSPPSSEPLHKNATLGPISSESRVNSHSPESTSELHASSRRHPPIDKKRKWNGDGHVSCKSRKLDRDLPEEPVETQPDYRCLEEGEQEQDHEQAQEQEQEPEQEPVRYWVVNGSWPVSFGKMSERESDDSHKRRRSSTPSYSSRARDRSAPPAHSPAYEEELQRYGIMFDDSVTKDLVLPGSKSMCETLLSMDTFASAYNSCSEQTYERLYHRATKCNEERVRRDLTPYIVPSAELLYLVDGDATLENIREEISVDWKKCSLLGGTQPRPDYAYGLSSATFTEEERAKMENYTNFDSPTKFTESLFFPFLLCEAKCGRTNINEADRQNIHSASIAVRAIVQLFRASGEDSVRDLHGQILVFSISHDNEKAKIYGHFPLFRDGRLTWHRYHVHEYSLYGHYGQDKDKGSNFTRAVYRDFYPLHLQRIRQAIARLPDPRTTSMLSDVSIDNSDLQASEHSSQEGASQGGPSLRLAKSQGSHKELALMKQTMARVERMYKEQLEQQQKQMEQQRQDNQKQMEQQQEQQQKQMEQLQKQIALLLELQK